MHNTCTCILCVSIHLHLATGTVKIKGVTCTCKSESDANVCESDVMIHSKQQQNGLQTQSRYHFERHNSPEEEVRQVLFCIQTSNEYAGRLRIKQTAANCDRHTSPQ